MEHFHLQIEGQSSRTKIIYGASRSDGQKIERLIRQYYSRLDRRDVFIDGGAHHGYHTSYARKFYSGSVIAVEASPKTFVEHLNSQRNQVADTPLCKEIPMNVALGFREKQGDTIEFFFSKEHPGRSTVNSKIWDTWSKGAVTYQTPIETSVVEIDDLKTFLASDGQIDFIKLDLEGNEVNALRGGRKTLTEDRPDIVMEFGLTIRNEAEYGDTLEEFRTLLGEIGYRAIAPWGEDFTDDLGKGYDFWYAFLFPEGKTFSSSLALLKEVYDESSAEK